MFPLLLILLIIIYNNNLFISLSFIKNSNPKKSKNISVRHLQLSLRLNTHIKFTQLMGLLMISQKYPIQVTPGNAHLFVVAMTTLYISFIFITNEGFSPETFFLSFFYVFIITDLVDFFTFHFNSCAVDGDALVQETNHVGSSSSKKLS